MLWSNTNIRVLYTLKALFIWRSLHAFVSLPSHPYGPHSCPHFDGEQREVTCPRTMFKGKAGRKAWDTCWAAKFSFHLTYSQLGERENLFCDSCDIWGAAVLSARPSGCWALLVRRRRKYFQELGRHSAWLLACFSQWSKLLSQSPKNC